MVKSVTIYNPFEGDGPLVLNLSTSHEEHGIYIKSITGIGPEKATINTTNLAMEDGGIFNSAKANIRNIVLDLGFYESSILRNSIEDSRHLTYQYFPKKKKITLVFKTDTREVFTTGWVESNEPDIFSKEEGTQISVICPDPNFYSLDEDFTVIGGIDGAFEFPFENNTVDDVLTYVSGLTNYDHEILTSDPLDPEVGKYYYVKRDTSEGIVYDEKYYAADEVLRTLQEGLILDTADLIIGEIHEGTIHNVYYYGDNDTGVTMVIHFLGPTDDITIENVLTEETLHIRMDKVLAIAGSSPDKGDDIIFSTIPGDKYLKYQKVGYDPVDILNAMDKSDFDNCWFKLTKGLNQYVLITDEGFENLKVTIKNFIAYDGI